MIDRLRSATARSGAILGLVFLLLAVMSQPSRAQETAPMERSVTGLGRFGHEFLYPVGSVFVPGLGQWTNGKPVRGWAFFGVAVGGLLLAAENSETTLSGDRLPRSKEAQLQEIGLQITFTSGMLSAYDSFLLSLPKLQVGGHYEFIEKTTPLSDALKAPVKFGFLKNKRTWIYLMIPLGIVAGYAIDQRDTEKLPFRWHDAAYAGLASYGAGVGEEGFFRGYLYPVIHEFSGERAWISNPLQATLFGLAHLGAVEVPWAQTLSGLYWGWVVKKSDWDIQETIFQHFWWDAIVFTGALLLDDGGDTRLTIGLPTIRF